MSKRRLIFTLLYDQGKFCQSRNFKCQKVGDLKWLLNNYKFAEISKHLDELHVLNINPGIESHNQFIDNLGEIIANVFIPVAVGGGVKSTMEAKEYLNAGADKILLNSLLYEKPENIQKICESMGGQSVAGIINYSIDGNSNVKVYDWKKKSALPAIVVEDLIKQAISLGIGEIILNSVTKDGTGFGFDTEFIKSIENKITTPVIASGGAGKTEHFNDLFISTTINGASTSNLLNFIGDSIPNCRKALIHENINLANF